MTTSLSVERRGSQRPRLANVPPRVSSAGQEAVDLAASAGLILDDWQAHVLDQALGERADGKWSAFEVGLLVARQNGKGAILEARELAGLFLFGERLILHSAHEFKTASEAFLRIKALVENTDDLRRQVKTVRTAHGDEGIELMDGRRLRFVARSRSSGRGFTGDCVILDEAQELPLSAMGALLPTLSARPNPQLWYTGTVPSELNNAEQFQSVRDRGRAGTSPKLAWLEWSAGENWNVNIRDRALWVQANPALGGRILEEFVEGEVDALAEPEVKRERLSIWPESNLHTVVDMDLWASLTDGQSQLDGRLAFSVDVTPDRSAAAIAVAGKRADGLEHWEVIEHFNGVRGVAERLAELYLTHGEPPIGLDTGSAAGSLIPDLERLEVPFTALGAKDVTAACGAFYDAVVEKRGRHLNQPELNAALSSAKKRDLAGAWAWHRRDSGDICPLVAVTLARFVWSTAPDDPPPFNVAFV